MPHEDNKVEFPVFKDMYGNRFIFPTVHSQNETMSVADMWIWCRQAELALSITEEKEPFVVDVDDEGEMVFTHIVTTAGSRGFEHGAETVWLIGGPEFDSFIARGASE